MRGHTAAESIPNSLENLVVNLRFPGQYYDRESGLSYNYFRDYDGTIGRYVQSDPIGLEAGSLSTYNYVDADPLSGTDPEGLANGSAAQMWMKRPPSVNTELWQQCLIDDPLFVYVAPFSLLPAVNLKRPGELRLPGSSRWTSVDRRVPGWPGANPNGGAVVRTVGSGTVQRVKFGGTYGTAAVAVGTFATAYSATAMLRCTCSQ